jgi:hypothetical protein
MHIQAKVVPNRVAVEVPEAPQQADNSNTR